MSSHLTHARSSLLGVALIIRSKEGPRFVFHYPPRLINKERQERPRYGTELAPTTPDTSDDGGSSDDNDLEDDLFHLHKPGHEKKSRHVNVWDGDEHYDSADGTQIVPWEHLDAFSTKDLASILTPAKSFHKKCFELTLDPLHFVTYPMHIREDGQWKKKKKSRKEKRRKLATTGAEVGSINECAIDESVEEQATATATATEPEEVEQDNHERSPTGGREGWENGNDDGGMTMFNLVFILNPHRMDAPAEMANIFEHVAKDINKALRYTQSYSNFVWKESDLILAMKEKAREKRRPMKSLWHKILQKSSLAATIREIYDSISTNNIANVRFMSNPPVRISVQIPKPYFLSVPPENDEESMPGLWITTANCLLSQDGDDGAVLNKHFALLLLDDEDKITAEIQADGGELAAPLLEYLKILRPTLSFQQTAQLNGISLSDIRVLAHHLIYYRRAIAIPPLHARDVYIISPNSDNHQLPADAEAWAAKFPLAPRLPAFLASLSSVPRPYKTFAPSKIHRPIYMEMLAWLLRHGYVTQLRTFAWVIVWPEIRYEVEYALDAERIKAAYRDAITEAVEEAQSEASASSDTTSASSTAASSEAIAEKARLQRLREKTKQDQLAFAKKPRPIATAVPSTNNAPHLAGLAPKVIKDPYRVNHLDSLYLEAISKRFKDEKTQKAFMRFARYFDGNEAFEMVALKEGLKRKETAMLMLQFEEFLLTTRHW